MPIIYQRAQPSRRLFPLKSGLARTITASRIPATTASSLSLSHPSNAARCNERDKIRIIKQFGPNFVHIIALQVPGWKQLRLLTVMVLPTGKMMRDEE
jgi:hypothetical protein